MWPVEGTLTSDFGPRWGMHHDGVDLAAPEGTPVFAAHAGRVVHAGNRGTLGLTVELQHTDGLTSRYAHLCEVSVKRGTYVEVGTEIGRVGSTGRTTGPHLHWELRANGIPFDPVRVAGPAPCSSEACAGTP